MYEIERYKRYKILKYEEIWNNIQRYKWEESKDVREKEKGW